MRFYVKEIKDAQGFDEQGQPTELVARVALCEVCQRDYPVSHLFLFMPYADPVFPKLVEAHGLQSELFLPVAAWLQNPTIMQQPKEGPGSDVDPDGPKFEK